MPIRACIIAMLLVGFNSAVWGQTIEVVIGDPLDTPVLGSPLVFPIFFHNAGGGPAEVRLPDSLTCRLDDRNTVEIVSAERIDPVLKRVAQAAPQGYVKTLYSLVIPVSMRGLVRLTVPAFGDASMLFLVETEAPTFMEKPPAGVGIGQLEEVERHRLDLSVFINAYQPYAKNLSFYRPMYFLVGLDPEDSKFQISLKYRFFDPTKPVSQEYPWVQNIFFGYTQTSFWDLASDSKPFDDTSYKPELFFLSRNIVTGLGWLKGFFVQTGFEHESNGRSGEESRSTNKIYLEPSLIVIDERQAAGLRIAPRFQVFVNDSGSNRDLKDYRGNFGLRLTFGRGDSFVADTHLQFAEKGTSIQVDLTYPLHRLFQNNLNIYLHVQYANALAESLLDYKERTEAVRIGLAVVR